MKEKKPTGGVMPKMKPTKKSAAKPTVDPKQQQMMQAVASNTLRLLKLFEMSGKLLASIGTDNNPYLVAARDHFTQGRNAIASYFVAVKLEGIKPQTATETETKTKTKGNSHE